MRILQLTGGTPRPWGIDLNPRLTVVHGLPDDLAASVRAAIDALVRARTARPEQAAAGLGGSVLVSGTEVPIGDLADHIRGLVPSAPLTYAELMGPTLALDAGRTRALDAEVVSAEAALRDAEAALAQARTAWEGARAGRSERISAGWRDRETAAGALRAARRRVANASSTATTVAVDEADHRDAGGPDPDVVAVAAERLEAADAAHAAALAAHDEACDIRDRVRPDDGEGDLDGWRDELAVAERETAEMTPATVVPEAERRALVDRRARIAAQIDALVLVPTSRVTAALASADEHGGIPAVEAGQVAVEWERVRDLVADADAAPDPDPDPVPAPAPEGEASSAATSGMFSRPGSGAPPTGPAELSADTAARLRVARDQVAVARRTLSEASGASSLDPLEVEALEAAHAEVLASWEGSERRIGVGKARRRLEEAQLAEREVLARMGFASYTEFMVSGRASGMPSHLDTEAARRALREAEERLAAAESAAESELVAAREAETAATQAAREAEAAATEAASPAPVEPAWDPDAAKGRLVATLGALRARAEDLLGEDPGDDVAERLRERIATDPLSDLRMALDEVGLPLGQVLSRDDVRARARAWVAEQDDAAGRRAALASERVEVEDHLARLDAAEGARVAWEALVSRRDELRVRIAEVVSARHAFEAAGERIERDRADVTRATAERADAERALADASEAGSRSAPPLVAAAVDVDLPQLEADARDAQTALDVAVAHLLPAEGRAGRPDPDAEADSELGRAEAHLILTRMHLSGLEAVRAARSAPGARAAAVDVDAVVWQILARMASQREVALAGGPGPTPLVLDEPFGELTDADAVRVCEALVGPASAVQTVVLTDRPEVLEWVRGNDPALVGAVTAASLALSPRP